MRLHICKVGTQRNGIKKKKYREIPQNIYKRSEMSCDQWIGIKQTHQSTGTCNYNYFEYLYNIHIGDFLFILFNSDAVSFACIPTKLSWVESRFSHCALTRNACTRYNVCGVSCLVVTIYCFSLFFYLSLSLEFCSQNYALSKKR